RPTTEKLRPRQQLAVSSQEFHTLRKAPSSGSGKRHQRRKEEVVAGPEDRPRRLLGSPASAVAPQPHTRVPRWVGTPAPCLLSTARRSPAGARCTMAAADFVQEMRSTGEKLLLKLQKLPQAEPVEIVAFSVILLFTATVLLLLLIACSCCCCPEHRGRKVQVRPMTPP
uniref:Small integral membrane protein 5 n=2 Tax=Ursus maritimus TaxID=29073 RepID=A0A452TVC9_URSMA